LDRIAFGVDDGHQLGGNAQGEQGRSELLGAEFEFLFDVDDLLAYGGQVIESQDKLPIGDVLGLPCADGLLGRQEQLIEGFRSDPVAAGGAQQLADFSLLRGEVGRGQAS